MGSLNLWLFNLIFSLSRRNVILDSLAVFLAEYLPYFLVLGFFWLVIRQTGWRNRLFFLCETGLALILSRGIITELIRFFYYSPRPFEVLRFQPLIPESGSSLPSGHAAFLFALSAAIFFYDQRWGIWYAVISFLNGLARIFTGIHWPADVLAGVVIGVLSGLLIHLILKNEFVTMLKRKPFFSREETVL